MDDAPAQNPSSSPTILLVEDNLDLRNATTDLLENLGYPVIAVRSGLEALADVDRPAIGLVIVNAYPTEGSGLDLVHELRAKRPSLPALLISGFGDDLELRRRVLAGQVGFLPIPFSIESLEAKIQEALEQKVARIDPADAEEVVSSSAAGTSRGRTGASAARGWLAAAAIVLAAGLAFQLGGQPADKAPALPAPEVGQTLRGQEVDLLAPVGEIERLPHLFAWRPASGAIRYRVVLERIDESVVWSTETRETSVVLPEYIADQLHPAVSYVWQVEGLTEDSSVVARSALVAFRFGSAGPA